MISCEDSLRSLREISKQVWHFSFAYSYLCVLFSNQYISHYEA